ncbi:MAG: hypothetical protein HYW03_06900 [Deltaproteobacteria bacterium]|nr:hypothetical protein [Deltaproteobacteria bacterium]
MPDRTPIENYNYSVFVGADDFLSLRTPLPGGSLAPDCEVKLLETGRRVKLSDYWKKGDVLIEFGSLT